MNNKKQEYRFPPKSILQHYSEPDSFGIDPSTDTRTDIMIKVFKQFGTEVWIEGIKQGPTFRKYRFGFKQGTFNSSILKHSSSFSYNILADDVRIIPPGPGNPSICVEVPNEKRFTVGFDCIVDALKVSTARIPMALGKDVSGESVVTDLAELQHVLLLGDEGSGKTICINSLINSILYSRTPAQVQLQIADCNYQGHSVYNGIPHLISPVMTDPQEVLKSMEGVCLEMERRMVLFKESGAIGIRAYNSFMEQKGEENSSLPYIVFIIDEFEPLMDGFKTEYEFWIKRITAVARFCGIHLILSTKHVNRNIVTDVIRLNIPSRLMFRVCDDHYEKKRLFDSDAPKLEPRGDFLIYAPGSRAANRIQGAFIDAEIEKIVGSITTWGKEKNT